MTKKTNAASFWQEHRAALLVLLAAAVIFAAVRAWAAPEKTETAPEGDYAEYETGKVVQILSDSSEPDERFDGVSRGEQLMTVELLSGQYKGEEHLVTNYVGPLNGNLPLKEGEKCTVTVNTYASGEVMVNVFENDRSTPLLIVLAVFLIVTVVVGGKTGAKSLLGLVFTVLCVFLLLFPALLKGVPTLPATFLLCAYVAAVSFVLLGGVRKKTVCAFLGSVAGMALALVFALIAQRILRVDGMHSPDADELLRLLEMDVPIRVNGLLAAGVILSSLGAVMDVAMSLSSALGEVHAADPKLDTKALFRSGMNIGRDMIGTMTNTLILAFLGGGLMVTLAIYTHNYDPRILISSKYLSIEVMTAVSSSVGVILSVPFTALISAWAYGSRNA